MSNPFIGEIRLFAGNFAPAGWATCSGQLIPISQNDALFTLLGTIYGGDGQETFALPNLASRVPVHQGQGPGISQNYVIGEMAGVESVTLTTQQIPVHNHAFVATTAGANNNNAPNNILGAGASLDVFYEADDPSLNFNATMLSPVGGNQPHENIQPYLCITFIISLFGLFPQFS